MPIFTLQKKAAVWALMATGRAGDQPRRLVDIAKEAMEFMAGWSAEQTKQWADVNMTDTEVDAASFVAGKRQFEHHLIDASV